MMSFNTFRLTSIYIFSFISLIRVNCDLVDESIYRTVETKNGAVRGILKKTIFHQKSYFQFMGIPFANPPVGELRFKVFITETIVLPRKLRMCE